MATKKVDINQATNLMNELHQVSERATKEANQYQARYDFFIDQFKSYCDSVGVDSSKFSSIEQIQEFLNKQRDTLSGIITKESSKVESIIAASNSNDWHSIARTLGIKVQAPKNEPVQQPVQTDVQPDIQAIPQDDTQSDEASSLSLKSSIPQDTGNLVDVPMVSEDGSISDDVAPEEESDDDTSDDQPVDIIDDSFYGGVSPIPQSEDVVGDSDSTSDSESTDDNDQNKGDTTSGNIDLSELTW